MIKPFLRAFAAAVAALGALAVAGGLVFYFLNSPSPGIPEEGRFFRVQRGESLAGIAGRLKAEGLVRSSALIKLVARLTGSDGRYQSGYFRIHPGDSTVDVHNLLVSGYQEQIKVTIPEGWSLKKIAQHLADKGLGSREELVAAGASPELLRKYRVPADNLEGYLYPDTYYFPAGYPAEAIVEQMAGNFFDRLKESAPEAAELSPEKLHEKLIVASIVEREYRRAEEAPLIASVFYNRLKYNIGLESCATLEYIITDLEDRPHPKYLTAEDKRINSPYNTYKWAGLPPGPISNPGRVALEAAFHPARTGYFYFVLKNPETGEHYFSESLTQHNWAKYIYLKQVPTGG
jgi:UPF0755 protein